MKANILKIALVLCLFIIGVMGFKLLDKVPKPNIEQATSIIDEAKTEAKVIARSVDQKGYAKTVMQRQADVIGNGDISKLPVSQSVIDSLRLDNLDKTKKLQQASLLNATLVARDLVATKKIDSLQRLYYVYHDDFTTAMFTPDSTGGKFDIDYRISLIRQDYKKRKNIFSPYVNYTEILSPDPRITINGLQSLTFKEERHTKWGIGIQGGYYYDPQQQKLMPALGFGISYNLIRF